MINIMNWRVTLSNGAVIDEGQEPYIKKDNEPLPWRRLCEFTIENNLSIAALEVGNLKITTEWARFSLGPFFVSPKKYAIQYCVEIHGILGGLDPHEYIDIIAIYEDFNLHYIANEEESYILITKGDEPIISALAQ